MAHQADLTLWVHRDGRVLSFELQPRDGVRIEFGHRLIDPALLASWPQYFDEGSTPSKRAEGSRRLFQLLPPVLQDYLWQHRHHIRTLHLQGDTSLPWEFMMLGGQEGGTHLEAGLLCENVVLSHWTDRAPPVNRLPLRRGALVCGAGLDAEAIRKRLSPHVTRRLHVVQAADVEQAMTTGAYDHWLIFGHGLGNDHPDEHTLLLDPQHALRPAALLGAMKNLGKTRPLIILASCAAGHTHTADAGWAARLIDAGAGAVVLPRLAIPNADAVTFVSALMDQLQKGGTLGQSCRSARERPFLGSHAVFALYGDPHATPGKPDDTAQAPSVSMTQQWRALPRRRRLTALLLLLLSLPPLAMITGAQALAARERLIRLEPLTYPVSRQMEVGATLAYRSLLRALITPFGSKPAHRYPPWLILAVLIPAYRLRRKTPKPVFWTILPLWTLFLFGLLWYGSVAAHAKHTRTQGSESRATSANWGDQLASESWSLLVNSNPTNDRRREELHGLCVWLLLAIVFTLPLLQPRTHALKIMFTGYLMLAVPTLGLNVAAFAYADWGLSYPRVILDPATAKRYGLPLEDQSAVFNVSAEAHQTALFHRVGNFGTGTFLIRDAAIPMQRTGEPPQPITAVPITAHH